MLLNSKMVDHLNSLVEALVKEEEDQNDAKHAGGTGPCFEYLLQKGVMDKLCALGLPDVSSVRAPHLVAVRVVTCMVGHR